MTDTKSHTQESQRTPREMNTKETNEQIHSEARHSKLLKTRDEEILTKACWGQENNWRSNYGVTMTQKQHRTEDGAETSLKEKRGKFCRSINPIKILFKLEESIETFADKNKKGAVKIYFY